jgi:opacity protein-like surface antigen
MKRLMKQAAVLLLAVPALGFAQASPEPGKAYLGARIGAVVPQAKDLDGLDSGFALEAVAGYRASEAFAAEFGVGRFAMSGSATLYDPSIASYFERTLDISAIPITVTGKAILKADAIELFALAGGGLYLISAKITDTAAGYLPGSVTDSANGFGFHLGAGLSAAVTPRASFGVEARYVIGSVKIWDTDNDFDSIIVSGGLFYRL